MVEDKILVKPETEKVKTKSGLYLPAGVQEKEKDKALNGYVIKCGPGYPIPIVADETETWKRENNQVKYIPLQAKAGDLAVFRQTGIQEIIMNGTKYFIVPNSSLLMLIRDEELL
jgi:co-chaperonin GroES (HSP10)